MSDTETFKTGQIWPEEKDRFWYFIVVECQSPALLTALTPFNPPSDNNTAHAPYDLQWKNTSKNQDVQIYSEFARWFPFPAPWIQETRG